MKVMMKLRGSGTCKFFYNVAKIDRDITDSGWVLTFAETRAEEEFDDADYVLREVTA